ncbi:MULTISPECIES: PAS domain-containing protein [Kordiimonas]|jgi:hypothetical protein|uniref:PAS domain-containing protein n=1 Tax=Kordiimonas TaxID=288021 RepID=UPI00257AFEF4|nr:PAS domain-containing protein [Kordiimonas sp. UBA4487]
MGRTRENLPGFSLEEAESYRAERPEVERVLAYFEERTGGKRLACRADIEPGQLRDILPDVCIMTPEFDPAGVLEDVKVRLMGTNVVNFYGEMTGKSIFIHPSSEVADRIFKSAAFCLERRKPVLVQAYTLSEEKNYLRVSVMYVPLSENNRDIDRLFLHVAVRRAFAC